MSCLIFHSQKNITTLGEGGMIYVKDKKLASKVPGLRHNGHCNFKFRRKNYWLPAMGNLDIDLKNQWPFKFTLSEIQCGAGIVMLKKLDFWRPEGRSGPGEVRKVEKKLGKVKGKFKKS